MSQDELNSQQSNPLGGSVPRERHVYVVTMHYADEGGPRTYYPTVMLEPVGKRYANPLPRLIEEAIRTGMPIEVSLEKPELFAPNAPLSDYTALGLERLMIFSRRAADVLRDLLAPCGSFVPLACPHAELVGFRLEAEADVLDAAHADISRTGTVYRYALHTDRLGEKQAFRVLGDHENLVLQQFVDTVRAHQFHGFRFCRVWPAGSERFWRRCRENWV